MQCIEPWIHLGRVLAALSINLVQFLRTGVRSRTALAAENLFLRKQLALCRERQVEPRRASDPLRLTLVLLARCFAWREALTIVQPATLVRWHREAFRLLWRWRSRPGRPRLPAELQLWFPITEMPRSGEKRTASETATAILGNCDYMIPRKGQSHASGGQPLGCRFSRRAGGRRGTCDTAPARKGCVGLQVSRPARGRVRVKRVTQVA